MALNPASIGNDMLKAAVTTAGDQWNMIKSVATIQIKNLARHLTDIARGVADGSLEAIDGKQLTAMAKNNAIAAIAMLTELVAAAIQKIINAALSAVKQAINAAAGIALL